MSVRRWLSVESESEGWDGHAALVDAAPPIGETPAVDPDAVAVIMYTSGTTGLPKGAMLTHANFWWNNANAANTLDILEDDVTSCSRRCSTSVA